MAPTVTDILRSTLQTALGLTNAQMAALSEADMRRLRNKTILTLNDTQIAKLSVTDQKMLGGV